MKKIIDYFPFFAEKELLELRINLLKDHVDGFIISEANKTHNGEDKEFICKKLIEELDLPKEKITVLETHIPDSDQLIPTECDYAFARDAGAEKLRAKNWARERLQRDALMAHINDGYDDDTVFILSDCDEIIDPKHLEYFSQCSRASEGNVIKVPLVLLEGRADTRVFEDKTFVDWSKSLVLCTKKQLHNGGSPTIFRGEYYNPYPPVWITQSGKRVEDCGWHFTWMGDENSRGYKARTSVLSSTPEAFNTLSSNSAERFGGGRNNRSLKTYPVQLLPKIIFDLPRVCNFLLPKEPGLSPRTPMADYIKSLNPEEKEKASKLLLLLVELLKG